MEHFNFPQPPDTTFPYTAHVVADIVIWTVAGVLFVYCLIDLKRTRSPVGLALMAGGALAYFNEPVDDVLGFVHHPRPGQNIVLDTIGAVPMWGLPTYIIFFGAIPFLFLRAIEKRNFSLRTYWIGLGITFLADLAIELPLLQTDLYQYYGYGDVPMEVARFPIYWLFINTTGPILCAAILFGVPGYFKGWRSPLVLLLPVVTDSACSIAVGLPVYSALHTPDASDLVRWGGAALTVVIGLVLLDGFGRWILARKAALAYRPPRASAPPAPVSAT